MNYLLSSVINPAEQDAKKESPQPTENRQEAKSATKQLGEKETAKGAEQVAANAKPEADELVPVSRKAGINPAKRIINRAKMLRRTQPE